MTAHYWPAKAAALRGLALESIATVSPWAAELRLNVLPAIDAAQVIREAVAARVEYRRERGDHFQSAADTLARGYDDCDGHAIIGAALAAAAGHPARIVGVSLDGVQPEHVRAEVGDASKWHSADSTGPVMPGEYLHAPIVQVHPASPQRATLPAPVGGYFDGITSDPVGWLTRKVEDIFGGVAQVGAYLTRGPVLSDLKQLIRDPSMILAVAAIVGCSAGMSYATAVSGGIAGMASGPCAAVMTKAYIMIAAETDQKVGPTRWKNWSDRDRANAVRRAEHNIGADELARRARTVERIVQMTPEAVFAEYPDVAVDMMAALRRHGDGEVRTIAAQLANFNRDPADDVADALEMLRHPNSRVRLAADGEFDRAVGSLERRIDAVLANCPPARPDVLAMLEGQFGDRRRAQLEFCQATDEQREAWRTEVRFARADVPPIRPDVREYLQGRHGARWSIVWSSSSPARRRDLVALTSMANGRTPPMRPDVREYLRSEIGDPGWADAWRRASDAQRDAWRDIARGRAQPVDITRVGLRERADFTLVAEPARTANTGGGGAGGLIAAVGLAALFLRG